MSISLPSFAFRDGTLKVERAYRHLNEIKHLLAEIVRTEAHMPTITRDDEGTYRLLAADLDALDNTLPLAIGDCVHNLRCALDHVWSALLRASVEGDPFGYFPFQETRQNLVDAVSKSPVKQAFPETERLILDEVKPYKDGDGALWTLNKLDNIDKHRLIVPAISVTEIKRAFITVNGEQFGGSIFSANYHVIVASNKPIEYKDKGQVAVDIIFPQGGFFGGESVVPTLLNLAQTVAKTVDLFARTFTSNETPTPGEGAGIVMEFS